MSEEMSSPLAITLSVLLVVGVLWGLDTLIDAWRTKRRLRKLSLDREVRSIERKGDIDV